MNTLRKFSVGFASFICILALSSFISLLTIKTTVMDRTVVQEWLNDSGIYDGKLVSALADTAARTNEKDATSPATSTIEPTPAALKDAMNATFTPDFVRTQIQSLVGNVFDWSEGKTPDFHFSIPVDQKRDEFIQQLATAIEPQVAALPVCTTIEQAEQSACRPANVSVEEFSKQVTTEGVMSSGALDAPITNQSTIETQQASSTPTVFDQLPTISSTINMLLYILPIVTLACIATVIFVTIKGLRIRAASRLSRRIFFSTLFVFIPVLALVWIVANNDITQLNGFNSSFAAVVMPLIKLVVIGVSSKLALYSGIVCALSLISWIIFSSWQRTIRQAQTETQTKQVPAIKSIPTTPVVDKDSAQLPRISEHLN